MGSEIDGEVGGTPQAGRGGREEPCQADGVDLRHRFVAAVAAALVVLAGLPVHAEEGGSNTAPPVVTEDGGGETEPTDEAEQTGETSTTEGTNPQDVPEAPDTDHEDADREDAHREDAPVDDADLLESDPGEEGSGDDEPNGSGPEGDDAGPGALDPDSTSLSTASPGTTGSGHSGHDDATTSEGDDDADGSLPPSAPPGPMDDTGHSDDLGPATREAAASAGSTEDTGTDTDADTGTDTDADTGTDTDADTGTDTDSGADPSASGSTGTTDDDVGDDGEVTTGSSEDTSDPQPGASGTATLVSTGNALAVGNLGENEVVQVIEVLVVDGGTVRIEQIAVVVSVGSARAHTGSNVVAAGGAEGSTVATVVTGDAVAIGNATITDIDQRLALEASDGQNVGAEQHAHVEHSGYAFASSGGNRVIAGGSSTGTAGASVTTTGNAYAIGNLSEVVILQDGTAAAAGDAWVSSEQHASVINRGVAVADTGGNHADGGAGASQAETGAAIAEGSVATNRIGQRAAAVARGGATVEMRQGSLVLNLGVAIARSGGNALDGPGTETTNALDPAGRSPAFEPDTEATDPETEPDTEATDPQTEPGGETTEPGTEPAPDLSDFDGFEEALLSIVLADELDLAGIGSVLQRLLSAALDEPIELWSHSSDETTTSWTDEESETMVEMIQRALVFDLGRAWVDSGDNTVLEEDGAAAGELRGRALAEIRSGHAFAIGNLAIAEVCQRMGINTDAPGPDCVPEPAPERPRPTPSPQPEPVLQEAPTEQPAPAEPTETTPEVLDTVVATPREPEPEPEPTVALERVSAASPAPALPRTGANVIELALIGLLLALLGAWGVRGTGRTASERADRRTDDTTW